MRQVINGMPGINFSDGEGRFTVSIGSDQVAHLLKQCADSCGLETGGILIGYYTKALCCAVVTGVVDAPPDSGRGRTSFFRGVSGLQALISRIWSRERHYYLGEWHFHPSGSPEASSVDIEQMKAIASSASYQCPEPILLIVGGSPESTWSIRVMVLPKVSGLPVELVQTDPISLSTSGRAAA
jgi:integrative and conjugative element protein (TIGR02256 family)